MIRYPDDGDDHRREPVARSWRCGIRGRRGSCPRVPPTTHAAVIAAVSGMSRPRPVSRCVVSASADVRGDDRERGADREAHREGRGRSVSVGTIRKPPPTPKKPVSAPITQACGESARLAAAVGRARAPGATRPSVRWLALRQVAAAATSMITANAAIRVPTADGVPERGSSERCLGSRRARTPPACRQQTWLSRAWPSPPASAPAVTTTSECGRRLVHALPEDVDEDGDGEHGAAAAEADPSSIPIASPKRDRRRVTIAGLHGRSRRWLRLVRPASLPLPRSRRRRRRRG